MIPPFEKPRRARIAIPALGLAVFLGFVGVRLYDIQIVRHHDLGTRANAQYQRRIPVASKRGAIYDRHGRALAISLDAASVFAHPELVQDPIATASQLAQVLKLPARKIRGKLRSDRPFVWIQRKVGLARAEAVANLALPGVGLVPEGKRYYPRRHLAAHVIGFAGLDNKGLEGVELEYDHLLRGGVQSLSGRVDALGRVVFREAEDTPAGSDLFLTIDEVIQHVAERELDAAIRRSGARSGTVIVVDPGTGEILALANLPSYNLNTYGSSRPAFRRNRALTDPYEPGSAFKLILAAAALEEGLVRPGDFFHGEDGFIKVAGVKIRDHEKYGWMTFRDVVAFSSNVGAVKVGMKVGKDLFYTYITSFGFGLPTQVDLPGENSGLVRQPRRWSRLSIGAVSIGHEISATPIQLITAVAAVANGGYLMRPHVVKAVRDPDGRMNEIQPFPVRRVISPGTARTLGSMLTEVVQRGTGQAAAIPGTAVAGKTGTAQKFDQDTGRYSRTKVVASFIGYVPAGDPRLAILVLIDEPQRFTWGGSVAAPVFREIAQEVLGYLKISPIHARAGRVARRSDEASATVN
ncbi:MAG: peptidoglycan D,D-transpeptidase FtsI family protein [Candidatus Methylomirabilales bacterium]